MRQRPLTRRVHLDPEAVVLARRGLAKAPARGLFARLEAHPLDDPGSLERP